MSLGLYFDHNVRAAIATRLKQRGIDVLVAFDDGYSEADDATILQRATALGRVTFTNDDDFLNVAHDWQSSGREFAGVIYVHQLQLTIGQTIADLEIISKAGNHEDFHNRIEFLPL